MHMEKGKEWVWLKPFHNIRNFGLGFWLCYKLCNCNVICHLSSSFTFIFFPHFSFPFSVLFHFWLKAVSLLHFITPPWFSTPNLVYSRWFIVSCFFCFSDFWIVTGIGYDDVSHMCVVCFGVFFFFVSGDCYLIFVIRLHFLASQFHSRFL